jgi:hypothetical protein
MRYSRAPVARARWRDSGYSDMSWDGSVGFWETSAARSDENKK